MQPGDRIAVKKAHGPKTPDITIRGIGLVKKVAHGIVYVNWLRTDMKRDVESKGCYATIHGPYTRGAKDGWINEVFCL